MEHSMINATSGGALVDKTNVYRGEKFDCQYGQNSQQFGARLDMFVRNENEIGVSPFLRNR